MFDLRRALDGMPTRKQTPQAEEPATATVAGVLRARDKALSKVDDPPAAPKQDSGTVATVELFARAYAKARGLE
jgi:hypothetical protein